MISRRGLLKAGGGLFGGVVVLGGIASETDYIDDPDEGEANQETGDNSESDGESNNLQNGGSSEDKKATEDSIDEKGTRETLYDTTVVDRLREEHEFSSGDVLHVEANVNHDGRGVFTLNVGPGEELRKTDIKDTKSFSLEIETDGTHIVNAIAGGGPEGRMDLLVELERTEG